MNRVGVEPNSTIAMKSMKGEQIWFVSFEIESFKRLTIKFRTLR